MKQILASAALLTLFFSACKKDSFTGEQQRATSNINRNASDNAAFNFNDQTDIDLTSGYYEINSCTGEHLAIASGTWHIDVHGVINNNKVSFDEHTNTMNYKLVSTTTGVEYTGSYASNFKYNSTFYNGLFTYTNTISVLLTTPGGKNNSILKFDEHVTINANGALTAFVDNFRSGCQ